MNTPREGVGVSCFHCGKPLPLRSPGVVVCPQCGADNYVELPAPRAPQPHPQPHPPPPPPWPAPRAPEPVAPPRRGAGGIIFAVIMLGLLGVGAVFLVRFLTARSQVASAIVSWVGSSRVCLADADGDGTDDVIGYGVSGGTSYLYALHHETGAILWRLKRSDDSYDPLFCEEGAVLTYREADQAVHALDPTSGARSWKLALSDKLGSVAFGKDCAVVKSIDGAVTPIGLSDGRASDCKGTRSALQAHTRTEPSTARRGDFEAVAIGVGTGTARVRVSATRAGKALWSTDLDDVASAGASLVAVEGAVIVVGVDRKTRELVVTRLDAKTGKSEATGTANIEDKSDTFSGVATNDETVFVMTFGMLHAFDAESLELRWYAGNMWGKKK